MAVKAGIKLTKTLAFATPILSNPFTYNMKAREDAKTAKFISGSIVEKEKSERDNEPPSIKKNKGKKYKVPKVFCNATIITGGQEPATFFIATEYPTADNTAKNIRRIPTVDAEKCKPLPIITITIPKTERKIPSQLKKLIRSRNKNKAASGANNGTVATITAAVVEVTIVKP